jgi:hypothetical protein
MSPTVLSESKTEFGRESYDQNGENGKFGHSDRRVNFLGENDSRQCHCGIVAWQCRGLVRVACENDMRLCHFGIVAGIVARVS